MGLLSRTAGGMLADRLGTRSSSDGRIALVVAAGFFLFSRMPADNVSYWRDIFPALLVLAVGMAASVAPLTSAVLSSADDRYSGVASGVNNAIARWRASSPRRSSDWCCSAPPTAWPPVSWRRHGRRGAVAPQCRQCAPPVRPAVLKPRRHGGGRMTTTCTHGLTDGTRPRPTRSDAVCEDCVRIGSRWVHLRMCLTCGHVGCCDSSKLLQESS